MKRTLLFLMVLVASTMAFAKANKQTVVFDVNLHCQGCCDKVMKNIAYEKGVKDLRCDLEKKQVVVVFDADKTSVAQLQKAFEGIKKPATINVKATEAAVKKATGKAIDATSGATVKQ